MTHAEHRARWKAIADYVKVVAGRVVDGPGRTGNAPWRRPGQLT